MYARWFAALAWLGGVLSSFVLLSHYLCPSLIWTTTYLTCSVYPSIVGVCKTSYQGPVYGRGRYDCHKFMLMAVIF